MSWRRVRLGDVCSKIGSGATPKGGKSVYTDSGVHQVRSQNVHNLQFSYDGLVCISDDAADKLSSVELEAEDVLLNITGDSVARVCQVPLDILPARVSQHVAIIRPESDTVRARFLAYYLASPLMQSHMLKLANGKGTSRNALTKGMIESFEVPCPPLDVQDSVVAILSSYDNLIENNRKQIALLEEAAQRLYKEWFIDLRFPGHEDVEIVDGLPQGWEMVPISEYADIVKGCSYKSENIDVAEGVPMVNLSSIVAWGGYKPYTERTYGGAYKSEQVLKANDVVMALTEQTAGLAGYVARIPHYAEGAVPSMDFACLRPKNGCSAYLYGACRYGNVSRSLSPLANGTKIKHLKPEALGYTKLLVPPVELQGEFDCVCNPLFRDIDALMEMNGSLQAARDRLLPKLISGEIEVS